MKLGGNLIEVVCSPGAYSMAKLYFGKNMSINAFPVFYRKEDIKVLNKNVARIL